MELPILAEARPINFPDPHIAKDYHSRTAVCLSGVVETPLYIFDGVVFAWETSGWIKTIHSQSRHLLSVPACEYREAEKYWP